MKKFTLTVFGLFLVAATFASVKPVKANQKTQAIANNTLKTTTQVNQISKVMALNTKTALGGPRGVIMTCATICQDDL